MFQSNGLFYLMDKKIKYEKVLVATGGKPNKLPVFDRLPQDKVLTIRSLDDFERLYELAEKGKNITIIGGGFLGSELAVALANKGKGSNLKINQVFREDGNMSAVLPKYLTKWTTKRVSEEGVDVKPNSLVQSATLTKDDKISLKLNNDNSLETDYVVLATGISPNVDIARKSGLEVDSLLGGIIVNAELESRSNVFAAGDATSYHDIKLGRRRIEHYDHACQSGRLAGKNMVGIEKKPYLHQPFFWSDLGSNISYEAVGIVDSSLNTVGVWAKMNNDEETNEYNKGAVFYTPIGQKKIVGVLMWNIFGTIPNARDLIGREYKDIEELAGLFDVHEEKNQQPITPTPFSSPTTNI